MLFNLLNKIMKNVLKIVAVLKFAIKLKLNKAF